MNFNEFIKERIAENKKIFTKEEIESCLNNLDLAAKLYKLGCLDRYSVKEK